MVIENSLEKKVSDSLWEILPGVKAVGVAVSGGADSVCLLTVLKNILPANIDLKAVTVNHNLRAEEETAFDADFVEEYCRSISVPCTRFEIERGKINQLSLTKKCGTEDAARTVRYECFNQFIEKENLDYLCLAHNLNDQCETVLMRFFQGSTSLYGINFQREKILRPLLNVSRKEIEAYLSEKKISYRTDSTNADTKYLRNSFRNKIIPYLENQLPGFQKSILTLSKKSKYDEDFISSVVEEKINSEICNLKNDSASFAAEEFFSLPMAVRTRIIYKFIERIKASGRISYQFVENFCLKKVSSFCNSSCGIDFIINEKAVVIQKSKKIATEEGFFAIIEEDGVYTCLGLEFCVKTGHGAVVLSCENSTIVLENLEFPFVFRSRQSGDKILSAEGNLKNVQDVLDSFKCGMFKDKIPLVQKLGNIDFEKSICCIWGEPYGFKNWIVRK
ncbi:MAG: tRNA lysidine(34) synthetase TilS [Treponema sp.]|nr:tRNA lysidine(34) synthetase TilS [Treponema sp.]